MTVLAWILSRFENNFLYILDMIDNITYKCIKNIKIFLKISDTYYFWNILKSVQKKQSIFFLIKWDEKRYITCKISFHGNYVPLPLAIYIYIHTYIFPLTPLTRTFPRPPSFLIKNVAAWRWFFVSGFFFFFILTGILFPNLTIECFRFNIHKHSANNFSFLLLLILE